GAGGGGGGGGPGGGEGRQRRAGGGGAGGAYLPGGAGPPLALARQALAERRAEGWDRVPVRVVEAPPTFLAGEETAAIARIGGRPALPRDKARLVGEAGLGGRPTLGQNVETLAHLALGARRGPAWFR